MRTVAHEPWRLTGSGPESYERYQVPSVFAPLARIFLGHLALRPGERVLDVACGTGIIAREVAASLGPRGAVVGIDFNAGMLEVARRCAPRDGATIEWRQADAAALPCADGAFDVVLCQQGLQFFPDRAAALGEMLRVLKPGGRLGLCVWRGTEHSPCHGAISAALQRHAGAEIARRFEAPFRFGDRDAPRAVIEDAGFHHVEIATDAVLRRLLPAMESVPGMLASTPVGPDFARLDPQARAAVVGEVDAALAEFRDGDGFVVPQSTHIAGAVKA